MKDLGVLKFGSPAPELINMTTLRRNLEMCLERLPTLLNLDAKKSDPASVLLPSVLSQLQALSLASETSSVMSSRDENLPETMSYALQQVSHLKYLQQNSQAERSQPESLVMLCKFISLSLFISLEIDYLYGL